MSDDTTIHPTHECFDDIADFLNDLAERGAPREVLIKYTVVHGICLMPPNGEPYAHGWLERDGFAIQAGIYRGERIYFRTPVDEYRAARFVWDETRYTLDEVLELDTATNRPPYRAEYKGLCNDTRPDRPGEPREWPAPPMTITDAWHHGPVTEAGRIFQLCTPCLERIRAKTEQLETTLERMDRVERDYERAPEASLTSLIVSTDRAEVLAWELYRVLCDRCKKLVPPPPVFP